MLQFNIGLIAYGIILYVSYKLLGKFFFDSLYQHVVVDRKRLYSLHKANDSKRLDIAVIHEKNLVLKKKYFSKWQKMRLSYTQKQLYKDRDVSIGSKLISDNLCDTVVSKESKDNICKSVKSVMEYYDK